jgi:hypothetical protein
MKKYLITYTDTEILTFSEAPKEGVTASGTNMLFTTLDNAIMIFKAMDFDVEILERI